MINSFVTSYVHKFVDHIHNVTSGNIALMMFSLDRYFSWHHDDNDIDYNHIDYHYYMLNLLSINK